MLKMKRLEFNFIRFLTVSSLVPLFLVLGMPSPAWSQTPGTGNWCIGVVVETPRGEVTAPNCEDFSAVVIEGETFRVTHGFIFESVGSPGAGPNAEVAAVTGFTVQPGVQPSASLTETARANTGDWMGSAPALVEDDWPPQILAENVIHIYATFGSGFTCSVGDCILGNGVIEVTYTADATGPVIVQNLGSMNSDGFTTTANRRQVATINIVRPQILADLRLNSGVAGGTLELTAVLPLDSTTAITLVTATGQTCLEEGTCQLDTSFSGTVNVLIENFPASAIDCAGDVDCVRQAEGDLPITLSVTTSTFTSGEASIAVPGVQYDLVELSAGDGAFRIDVTVDGSTSVMRVNVGADQTPPTVPAGFALSCAPTAYSALCSWPAGIDDPAPGSGLADFEVILYQAAADDATPTSCAAPASGDEIASETVPATAGAASVDFVSEDIVPSRMYFACLTVQDGANNMAAGSPFSSNFMTLAYQRGDDEDGDGVSDDLEVFGPYANLAAAVADLGENADGFDGPDSIAFAYGLPSQVPDFGALEPLTCNPDYARNEATANLETSCAGANVLNGRTGWIIHVANGDLYLPTTAPALAEIPRAPGRYLISRVDGDTANLAVLTVLPQLGISYLVDEDGLALAPPDENPAQPADPTEFQVGALFGEGAIAGAVTLSIAIVHSPDDEPEPMSIPPMSTTLTVAIPTLASTTAALIRHTGIRIEVANTVMFSGYGIENVNAQVASFTLADDQIMDLDFIRVMLMDIVYASSETNIVCSTPQEGNTELADAPAEVMPGPLSCTVSIGGSDFDPDGGNDIVELADSGGGGGMLGWLSLVALAALTMLSGLVRRRGIAVAAALLLAAGLSPAAFAQPSTLSDPSHWRLGVDIGLGLIEPHASINEDNVFAVDDDSDFGWRISLEHDSLFHKDVGLEIFWADLGEAEVSDRENEEFSADVEANIFGIGAVWHLRDMDFVADWSPYGSLGYRYVDGDLSGNFVGLDVEHENGVYWNIGVEGSVYRDWNLLGRVFYEAYDEDLGFWGVGLVWHLGESSAPPRKKDKAKATKDRKAKKRSASRQKAKSSASARRDSSRRAPPRRDVAAAGECQVPKGMTPKGWYVQVITYASADRARSMQAQLTRDGYTAGVADRGGLYVVRAVTDTCAKAQRIKRQLRRKLGVEPFVRPYESHVY